VADTQNVIYEKSCGAIVCHKKNKGYEYLLLHYPEGHWDFPKGHVEKGETEVETALRELEEETGIKKVSVEKDFRETIHYFFTKNDALISKTVAFYLVVVGAQEVAISHEHKNFIWLPYKKAFNKITFKNAKEILEKANNFKLDN